MTTRSSMRMLLAALLLVGATLQTPAQQMPQDHWKYYGEHFDLSVYGAAAAPDGRLYVGKRPDLSSYRVAILGPDMVERSVFGNFTNLRGIAVAGDRVFVFDVGGTQKIHVFGLDGTFIKSWGPPGTGDGQFASTFAPYQSATGRYSLMGASLDRLYVLDADNYRVQAFTLDGAFIAQWGSRGDLPGQFTDVPSAIAVMPDNRIVVYSDFRPSPSASRRLTSFSASGDLIDTLVLSPIRNLGATPDGLLVIEQSTSGIMVFDAEFEPVTSLRWEPPAGISNPTTGICVTRDGTIVMGTSTKTLLVRRQYYPVDLPLVPNAIPMPVVSRISQRPGTTLLDIDYRVTDADSAAVHVAMLIHATKDGTTGVIIPSTFVEGTGSRLGPGQATNATHRVSWDAGADWNVDLGTVSVEILAKDDRGLQPQRWDHAPGDPDPDLTPIVHDAEGLLMWLLAIRDPEVALVDGQVRGVGGAIDGVTLFAGQATPEGLAFLQGRLASESTAP